MKTNLTSAFRTAALTVSLLALPVFASANDTAADRAAQLLALHGSVSVRNAGPYVEVGTFKIQVAVKLGHPSARLADGSWLYDHRAIEGSTAEGTLVVRFQQGRVSALSFVTPTIATALRTPQKATEKILVAASK